MTASRDQAPDLFGTSEGEKFVEAPLAERLRPREFVDFVGQEDIIVLKNDVNCIRGPA